MMYCKRKFFANLITLVRSTTATILTGKLFFNFSKIAAGQSRVRDENDVIDLTC